MTGVVDPLTGSDEMLVQDVARRGRSAVLALVGRTLLMRGVTVLGIVILARILTPADFGVFAVLVTWQTVLTILGDGGLGASLIQQPHAPTRLEIGTAWLAAQALWMPLVIGAWVATAVLPVSDIGEGAAWQIRLVSLTLILTAWRAVPSATMTRDLRFGVLASIDVVGHLLFYATAITLAAAGAGTWSFVVALLAQALLATILVNLAWGHRPHLAFDWLVLQRQVRFGLPFQASNLVLLGRDAAIPLFGGLAGGVAAIGQLQFAARIGLLAAAVDDILGRVAFPAFSRLQSDRSGLARAVVDTVLTAGVILGAIQGWLIAVAPVAVPIVFGDQWLPGILALQLICLGTLATVPTRFLRALLFSIGRPRQVFRLAVVGTALVLVLFPPMVLAFGIAGGGAALAVSGWVVLWLHVRACADVVDFPWLNLTRVYLVSGVAAIVGAVVAEGMGGIAGLVASGLVFGALDLALLRVVARGELDRVLRFGRGVGAGPARTEQVPG